MISWTRKTVVTGEITNAMGADPVGYIACHADGRMMAVVIDRHRPKLKAALPDDADRFFDSMLAYAASYTVEEDRVIHHVDASWNPAWGTSALIRPYSIDGRTLVISGAPGQDPATGEEVVYELEFRKV